jgi:small subunit ribosomal protein S8
MLTRIRNANIAMHDEVTMPSSKLKESLAGLLEKEGYIVSFSVADNPRGPGKVLNIDMKYSPERKRVISGIKRVSKPGLRVYRKHDEVERVLGGLGIAVLSTSKGLMTDREARRQRVGGEVLCHVW